MCPGESVCAGTSVNDSNPLERVIVLTGAPAKVETAIGSRFGRTLSFYRAFYSCSTLNER